MSLLNPVHVWKCIFGASWPFVAIVFQICSSGMMPNPAACNLFWMGLSHSQLSLCRHPSVNRPVVIIRTAGIPGKLPYKGFFPTRRSWNVWGGRRLGCTCPIQALSNPALALVHGQLLRSEMFASHVGGAVPLLPYRWPSILN